MYELTVCNTSLSDDRTEEMGERITRAITFISVTMARPSIVILFDLSRAWRTRRLRRTLELQPLQAW